MKRFSAPSAALLALGILLAAPRPARADAVDDIAKVVNLLPGMPINGQDILASRDLFSCLDKASGDTEMAACVDAFNSSPVGQKALGLPSWFHTLINVYIDIREGDFLSLVKDAGFTIACAIANATFGVDVCGIAQAILETLGAAKEFLSDVVGFIEDVGGAIADFFGFGGGSSGPPLWQVVYNKYLKPNLASYAENWLEQHEVFKTEFDVTGQKPQSLLCTIVPKEFGKTCAWLFAPAGGLSPFDAPLQPWFRGDTIKAIQMAQAAALAQAIATVGKRAKEWVDFKHDWNTDRAPADHLRKAYGIWGPVHIRLDCTAATQPWKQFLDQVGQPEVKPEAAKALAKLSGWAFESTTQFCHNYEAGLKPDKLKSCVVVGTPNEKAMTLDCEPGQTLTTCNTSAKAASSTKFPPAFALTCKTHALKMPKDQGNIVPKVPQKITPPPGQLPPGQPVPIPK